MVGGCEIDTHQRQDRPQEAFRLAQGQPEDKAERQRRLDRTVRERLRRAWSTGRRRAPRVRRRRQRATASRPLAGPRPARTLTNSPRDTSSCTSDGPLISCRDRAPAAVTVAREPTAASSQPKGCAPTPCAASARARASIFGGGARRPASHVRYDSGDAPSVAANAACDWPNEIRHSRSVQGSTTSHHAIGAGRCEARGWRGAYFSQPIFEPDRSLFSPVPSPLVTRQRAQSENSLGKWRARQDSNLRPSA